MNDRRDAMEIYEITNYYQDFKKRILDLWRSL